MISPSFTESLLTRRLQMQGLVQGRGIRPAVARLAFEFGLGGTVQNTARGVDIQVIGVSERVNAFELALRDRFHVEVIRRPPVNSDMEPANFRIVDSVKRGSIETVLPVDLATCAQCIDEIRSTSSRRFRYPFTSCTDCGPRYSIIREMPFDRARTSMDAFPMCAACQREYCDPTDRRFHAQTSSCPACGPNCWSTDKHGRRTAIGFDAIETIAKAIRTGMIAAIKGLGGYQLVCDATNRETVNCLRTRKRRPTKPFPVMVDSVETAKTFASIQALESELMSSSINPIVLLRSRFNPILAESIHPRLADIGIMLPTTPLHWLIMERIGRPVVVTSANAHGSPIAFQIDSATVDVDDIADVWLDHDRQIIRPIDDSVIRCIAGHPLTIRAGRGIAPLTIRATHHDQWLAVGGHQKVAIAISTDESFVLAPYLADMDSEASRHRFDQQTHDFPKLYGPACGRIACDRHPDFFTTEWAKSHGTDVIRVQHHHAHVAAAMLDHGLEQETVLGFAFDGTGYGADETVWGGEVLLATASTFQRVAQFRPFALPGGEMAIKQPWRTAMAMLEQACDRKVFEPWLASLALDADLAALRFSIGQGSPTTSAGRLFDAVAALVLPPFSCYYEGEPAMMLEAACDPAEESSYHFAIESENPHILDWRSCLAQILADKASLSAGRIAMKFHRAVANAIVDLADRFREYPAILSGGVFQNRVLVDLIDARASAIDLKFHLPGRIPVNDGGLAIGQLVVAASQTNLQDRPIHRTGNH